MFYRHKYLTMPTKTKADTVEEAGKDLKKAIEGGIPQFKLDKEAIEKPVEIFRKNADAARDENSEQKRAKKQSALEQRVYLEKKQSKRTSPAESVREKEKPPFDTRSR